MSSLIKSNFSVQKEVLPQKEDANLQQEYEKKALENIGGSMVFVERNKLLYDKK